MGQRVLVMMTSTFASTTHTRRTRIHRKSTKFEAISKATSLSAIWSGDELYRCVSVPRVFDFLAIGILGNGCNSRAKYLTWSWEIY